MGVGQRQFRNRPADGYGFDQIVRRITVVRVYSWCKTESEQQCQIKYSEKLTHKIFSRRRKITYFHPPQMCPVCSSRAYSQQLADVNESHWAWIEIKSGLIGIGT